MPEKSTTNGSHGKDIDSMPASWAKLHWYVLFVRVNQERMIAHRLEYHGVEFFLPCYRVFHEWKDRVVKQDRPLFPGYIFVRIPFTERAKVLMLPNVVSLVGVKTSPSVVSEEEIAWIRAGMDQAQAEPHPYCKVGERVMITQGALAGVEGVLLREGKRPRVVITVESIHRSFSVEVEAGCIGVAEKPIFDPVSQDAVRPGAASVREKISLH